MNTSTLAAMSPDHLADWITYHEGRIEHDTRRLAQLEADGPGLSSEVHHVELVKACHESMALSRKALDEMCAELQQREGQ